MDDLDGYLRAKEPGMREKAYAWKTAIGLQKVDGLTPSDYLIATAKKNIEGEITLAESRKLIEGYYKSRPAKAPDAACGRSLPVPESALVPSKREQVGEQVKSVVVAAIRKRPTRQVARLLGRLKGEMTVLEMMAALKLGGRRNFLERYLSPAMDAGWVEMTDSGSPRSPAQRYRLTATGAKMCSMMVKGGISA